MYPEIVPIEGNIELIQNSGVQFVDYEVLLDWKNKDSKSVIRAIENGYFVRVSSSPDEPLVRLVPHFNSEVTYVEPINKRQISSQDAAYTVSLKQSLALFDGVWFPIPYLTSNNQCQFGPINWARARIVKITDQKLIDEAKARQNFQNLGSERVDEVDYSNLNVGLAGTGASESSEEATRGLSAEQIAMNAASVGGFYNGQFGGNGAFANDANGAFGNGAFANGVNAGFNGQFGANGGFNNGQFGANGGFNGQFGGNGAFAGAPNGANVRQAPKSRSDEAYYRIVFAFDTHTQSYDENSGYLCPTERDVESGCHFKFAYTADFCQEFLKPLGSGLPWVREWAEAVFRDLYRERVQRNIQDEDFAELMTKERMPEAHYLNLLAFLGFMVKPADVHFISNQATSSKNSGLSTAKVVDVSLILDIGNSRTCGIMVEDHPNVTRGDDDFSDTYVLTLRDLNTPEQIYNQPFASRIEFARANFDYDNRSARSSRPDAFSWPSIVRVGTEACNLSAHREGNEGSSGISSPKRYLWNTDPLINDRWIFNNYSYQIESAKLQKQQKEHVDRAYINDIGRFFNSYGKAYFAFDENDHVRHNLESRFSNRSTMTFMLIEILNHAMSQMNSVAQRSQCTSKDAPRRLKAIVITTPPGMPAEEKELYRACVYEALGILWKALGFDKSDEYTFQFKRKLTSSNLGFGTGDNGVGATGVGANGQDEIEMEAVPEISPAIPDVYMDWNEAEAGQVVYIYNESQKTFKGDCKAFIRNLRRDQFGERLGENLIDSDGDPLLSARIATLDIGGGTTDLVIKDYSFKRDVPLHSADIIPHEILRDGSKIAGDDIVHDLISHCIMTRLFQVLQSRNHNPYPVLDQLVGDNSTGDVQRKVLRMLFTQQILVQLAYKLLFHLENLDPFATSCVISGTVRTFLMDEEVNSTLDSTVRRPGPCKMPAAKVVAFADKILGKYLPGFSIMDFYMSFDLVQINNAMVRGKNFNITRILSKFGEVITAFNCDLLLLTGRSSKLPAVRQIFMQRLNLPSSRILPMHQYRCESWYPFKSQGEFIGDPKTTAAVGALIGYLRLSHDKFPNFRFYSCPDVTTNNAHYVGIIKNNNMIPEQSVLYKYESASMVAKKNQSDKNDEEHNFVPYTSDIDNGFQTQLSVEIGYRLLDDPDFEATPLYKIEAYDTVDDIRKVQKALSLTWDEDLSREHLNEFIEKLDSEVQDTAHAKIEPLLSQREGLSQQIEAYRQNLEQQLVDKIRQEGLIAIPEVGGIKGILGGKSKADQERNQWMAAQYQARYESEVQIALQQYELNLRSSLDNEIHDALDKLLDKNLQQVRSSFMRKKEKLDSKLKEREPFNIKLKVVNKHSPYPLAFISANLTGLKKVDTFELDEVLSLDGTNFTDFFQMRLKTVSSDKVKYFIDSGVINLTGIDNCGI